MLYTVVVSGGVDFGGIGGLRIGMKVVVRMLGSGWGWFRFGGITEWILWL